MRSEAGHSDICIRDISSRGMLVQAATAPPRGTYVEILRPGGSVTARVVWSKDRRFGLQSRDRIDMDAILDRRRTQRAGDSTVPAVQMGEPQRAPALARGVMSRHISSSIQFGFLVMLAAIGAMTLGAGIYAGLSGALGSVSAALAAN